MNIFEKPTVAPGEARLLYKAGDYTVLIPGDYVRCAVTARPIPLGDLRYWSIERQEPYADIEASLKRMMKVYRPAAAAPRT